MRASLDVAATRSRRIALAGAGALCSALLVTAAPAAAQQTVFIGGSGLPGVEVNLDVLRDVGRPFVSPRRLLMPGATLVSPGQRITLRPPGERPRQAAVAPPPAAAPEPEPIETVAGLAPDEVPEAPDEDALDSLTADAGETGFEPGGMFDVDGVDEADENVAESLPETPAEIPAEIQDEIQDQEAESDEPIQLASLPPEPVVDDLGNLVMLQFPGSGTALSEQAERVLTTLALQLLNTSDRVQVKAYAGQAGDLAGSARRLSLKRALAVRSHLIENGVRSTRIDVRALGVAHDGGPADRVDVEVVSQ